MSDLFILCAGIALGQVVRIHVSPEHLALGTRAIQKAIAQLPAVERGVYRILDSLGLSSPTQRLDAYFEHLAQDGTIELEDVAPTADEITLTSAAKRITAASKARSTRVKIESVE
jgi:hypothetical protein